MQTLMSRRQAARCEAVAEPSLRRARSAMQGIWKVLRRTAGLQARGGEAGMRFAGVEAAAMYLPRFREGGRACSGPA